MRRILNIGALLLASVVGIALLTFAVLRRSLPLGWPGEWTWNRLAPNVEPNAPGWILGVAAITAFAGVVYVLGRWIGHDSPGESRRAAIAVALLALLTIVMQTLIQTCAPDGYGLTRWPFTLHSPGSNGYYIVARGPDMTDSAAFLRGYPEWVRQQDALHVGTHPPGLFLLWRAVLGLMRSQPEASAAIIDWSPASFRLGLKQVDRFDPLAIGDQAAIVIIGWITLLICALTVVPIYGLARTAQLPARFSFQAAALWSLLPAAILFQPTADTTYPTLAASAVALAAQRNRVTSILAGAILGLAMQLTLAFLAVGFLVALYLLTDPARTWRERALSVLLVGCGFLGFTVAAWVISGGNPFATWWWNQRNHARFYEQFSRSYWVWIWLNPFEFFVALGIPVAVCVAAGLPDIRATRLAWLTLAVLLLLEVSGRNLSEVARLWLPFMPMLLPAAAFGISRAGGRDRTTALILWLVGMQTLILQSCIQVVYAAA